jgi:hypothetical protein
MRTLQRKNIKSFRVEIDKQICSPDTNASLTPDDILDKLEDYIIESLTNSQNVKNTKNPEFVFKYLSEDFHSKVKGIQTLTSIALIIKKEDSFSEKIESLDTNNFSEDEDTELARYRIVFNQDMIYQIKADCITLNDLADIDWFDEDGEEYDAYDDYIKDQITDAFDYGRKKERNRRYL